MADAHRTGGRVERMQCLPEFRQQRPLAHRLIGVGIPAAEGAQVDLATHAEGVAADVDHPRDRLQLGAQAALRRVEGAVDRGLLVEAGEHLGHVVGTLLGGRQVVGHQMVRHAEQPEQGTPQGALTDAAIGAGHHQALDATGTHRVRDHAVRAEKGVLTGQRNVHRELRQQRGVVGVVADHLLREPATPAGCGLDAGTAVGSLPLQLLVVVGEQVGRQAGRAGLVFVGVADRLEQGADIRQQGHAAALVQCGQTAVGRTGAERRVQAEGAIVVVATGIAGAVDGDRRTLRHRDRTSRRRVVAIGRPERDEHVERVVPAEQKDADQRLVVGSGGRRRDRLTDVEEVGQRRTRPGRTHRRAAVQELPARKIGIRHDVFSWSMRRVSAGPRIRGR